MHIGWLLAVCPALALPPSTVAFAASADTLLRRSERIDSHRLGRVSDTERSVLRVEWHAKTTGADETHRVQEMVDSLRRMEATVGEISRLVGRMPSATPPAALADTAQPPDADRHTWRLAMATLAAAGLVALWWLRRRHAAKAALAGPATEPTASLDTAPEASLATAPEASLATAPAASRDTEPAARLDTAPETARKAAPDAAPQAASVVNPDAAPEPSTAVPAIAAAAPPVRTPQPPLPAADVGAAKPPEPYLATVAFRRDAAPPAVAAKPMADAAPTGVEKSAAPPAAEIPPIEFSLEEADPEAVARANARVPAPAPDVPQASRKASDANVDPTLELAEIMLSMGLAQGAAQTLVEYSEAHPRQALYHWLKLLDIYRHGGHREDFQDTAEKLRQHFNIQAEDWARASAGDAPTLESFPRVSQRVQQLWSQPQECAAYLRHLLEDNREGSRAGFPRPVAEEILLLIEILKPAAAQAPAT